VGTVDEIVPWLQEAIAHFYPASSYARSLSPEFRERTKQRLFQAPKTGAQVICPHCGAPHATPPGTFSSHPRSCQYGDGESIAHAAPIISSGQHTTFHASC
jgi:hypothetical protein